MNEREALKLALEALDDLMGWQTLAPAQTQRDAHRAITTLRQVIDSHTLASAPGGLMRRTTREEKISNPGVYMVPIAPLKREWQNLTDDEIKDIIGPWGDTPIKGYARQLFDQIEAKLKEKNT